MIENICSELYEMCKYGEYGKDDIVLYHVFYIFFMFLEKSFSISQKSSLLASTLKEHPGID